MPAGTLRGLGTVVMLLFLAIVANHVCSWTDREAKGVLNGDTSTVTHVDIQLEADNSDATASGATSHPPLPPLSQLSISDLDYNAQVLEAGANRTYEEMMKRERYQLPPQPPPARNVTYNAGTSCEYTVDNVAISSPILAAKWLSNCGGAVRGRPQRWPRNEPDPMLECSPAASHVYMYTFGWIGGYRQAQPALDNLLQSKLGSNFVLWAFQDFGCHTAYRGPDDVIVGYLLRGSLNYALTVRPSPQLVDVGSQLMTYSYRTGDIHRWWWERHAVPAFERARDWAASLATSQELNVSTLPPEPPAVPDMDMGFAIVGQLPMNPTKFIDVRGDAIVVSTRYPSRLLGQIFSDTISAFARMWTSGLLDRLPNAPIVLYRSEERKDDELRSWIVPLLDGRRIVWIGNNDVARIERPWFPHVKTTFETAEPCMNNFVANYLLPRALRIVRADMTFPFGNDTMRNDSSVSDREWASTFPKKLAVFKSTTSGRSLRGVFQSTPQLIAMISNEGYIFAADTLPFSHRFALLNFCDVVMSSFGSTMALFTMAWGGNTAAHRPGVKLRVITLMEQGYHFERFLWAPRRSRLGQQLGLEVLVSEFVAFGPRNMWQKGIVIPRMRHTLTRHLRPAHIRFEVADCTTNATNATDFASREVACDPRTWKILRPEFFQSENSTWNLIPRYGQRCPKYWP
jgi:hypothetical protein